MLLWWWSMVPPPWYIIMSGFVPPPFPTSISILLLCFINLFTKKKKCHIGTYFIFSTFQFFYWAFYLLFFLFLIKQVDFMITFKQHLRNWAPPENPSSFQRWSFEETLRIFLKSSVWLEDFEGALKLLFEWKDLWLHIFG